MEDEHKDDSNVAPDSSAPANEPVEQKQETTKPEAQAPTSPPPAPTAPRVDSSQNQATTAQPADKKKSRKPTRLMIVAGLGALLTVAVIGLVLFVMMNRSSVALTEYSSDELGFSIDYPEGWDVTESTELIKGVSFQEKSDDENTEDSTTSGAEMAVTISEAAVEANEVEESDYFGDLEQGVQASLGKPEDYTEGSEYGELVSAEMIEVDGYKAYKVDVEVINFEGNAEAVGNGVLVFVYVDKAKQVTLLYEGNSEDDGYYKAFNEIVKSFDLK